MGDSLPLPYVAMLTCTEHKPWMCVGCHRLTTLALCILMLSKGHDANMQLIYWSHPCCILYSMGGSRGSAAVLCALCLRLAYVGKGQAETTSANRHPTHLYEWQSFDWHKKYLISTVVAGCVIRSHMFPQGGVMCSPWSTAQGWLGVTQGHKPLTRLG